MSSKVSSINLVVLVVVLALLDRTAAQTSGCTSTLISLSPCLSYVTGNRSTPTTSCCSQLANVVQSQPQCLCVLVNGGSSNLGGMNINQTLALALPGACNVQTPPTSRCNSKFFGIFVYLLFFLMCVYFVWLNLSCENRWTITFYTSTSWYSFRFSCWWSSIWRSKWFVWARCSIRYE